jgi:hypothetical protein
VLVFHELSRRSPFRPVGVQGDNFLVKRLIRWVVDQNTVQARFGKLAKYKCLLVGSRGWHIVFLNISFKFFQSNRLHHASRNILVGIMWRFQNSNWIKFNRIKPSGSTFGSSSRVLVLAPALSLLSALLKRSKYILTTEARLLGALIQILSNIKSHFLVRIWFCFGNDII